MMKAKSQFMKDMNNLLNINEKLTDDEFGFLWDYLQSKQKEQAKRIIDEFYSFIRAELINGVLIDDKKLNISDFKFIGMIKEIMKKKFCEPQEVVNDE